MVQAPSAPVVFGADDEVPTAGVDIENTAGMGDGSGVQQQGMGQDENVAAGSGGIHGWEPSHPNLPDLQAAEERVDSPTRSPGRPQRTRRPNVKYSQEEYDLSTISAHKKQARISGISVNNMKNSLVVMSPESWGNTSKGFRTGPR